VLKNSASDQPQWIGETNMADPVIYGPAFSTYVRSVLLALEEKGVPYHLEQINILEGAHQTPEHRARHPFAKVPAFEHDGFELYETLAILRYVDETFDGPSLQPDDPRARARMTQVLAIVDAYAYPVCIGACVIQRLVVPLMGGTPDEDVVAAAVPQATTSVEAPDPRRREGARRHPQPAALVGRRQPTRERAEDQARARLKAPVHPVDPADLRVAWSGAWLCVMRTYLLEASRQSPRAVGHGHTVREFAG
jgi:glutathione S-transferase